MYNQFSKNTNTIHVCSPIRVTFDPVAYLSGNNSMETYFNTVIIITLQPYTCSLLLRLFPHMTKMENKEGESIVRFCT